MVPSARGMKRTALFPVIFVIQALCAFFFVTRSSLGSSASLPADRLGNGEPIEIGAAFGLILGVLLGGLRCDELFARHRAEESCVGRRRLMRGLEERFHEWGLTPSEKDVALFAIKGMSTPEIANAAVDQRRRREGADERDLPQGGGHPRPQLLWLFIEDLMRDDGTIRPMP